MTTSAAPQKLAQPPNVGVDWFRMGADLWRRADIDRLSHLLLVLSVLLVVVRVTSRRPIGKGVMFA